MLSSVYQESSASNPRFAQIDPDNRLLWRANIRRLEFEALRDSLLAVGGDLDPAMFGRPVDLETEPYSTRRTIYGIVDRSDLDDTLVNFDFASPDLPTGQRHETTVPQQALFMMNSPLVVEQAKRIVALADFHACSDDASRIQFLYRRVYQRVPRPEEITLGIQFISETKASETSDLADISTQSSNDDPPRNRKQLARRQNGGKGNGMRKRAPLSAWQEYAHALLQANEASFVN